MVIVNTRTHERRPTVLTWTLTCLKQLDTLLVLAGSRLVATDETGLTGLDCRHEPITTDLRLDLDVSLKTTDMFVCLLRPDAV